MSRSTLRTRHLVNLKTTNVLFLFSSPGSYEKNLCLDPYEKCTPCPERLPSCVGLPDGDNVFAGKIWSQHYVVCYKNRTKTIKQCSSGFFDPQNRKCSSQVGTGKKNKL